MSARTRRGLIMVAVIVFAFVGVLFLQIATKGALVSTGRTALTAACALIFAAFTGLVSLVGRLGKELDDLRLAASEGRERGDDT